MQRAGPRHVSRPRRMRATKFTGKERDAESGIDFFNARYMSSAQGRFTSPDPSRLSAVFGNPQTWNMYTYGYNNPLQFVDKNGRWPTKIHNDIIEQAFRGTLTRNQIQILKDVSAQEDSPLGGGQGNARAFQHPMRAPWESVAEAEAEYQDFVSTNEDAATKAQVNFWIAGNPGFSNDALKKFALALHAILDSTSPAHAGFQVWDWRNLPDSLYFHERRESTINQQQLSTAVAVAQNAFNSTFSTTVLPSWQSVLTFGFPQIPAVQSTICYTLAVGTVVCQ
jgi:RHS repeat-associated protein